MMAARALSYSGVGAVLRRVATRPGVLVLAYHRIGDGHGELFDRGVLSATADRFDAQVRWLKRNYDIVAPTDLEQIRRSGQSGRYVLITFDDGYRDNHDVALPVLRSHAATGTFFVATGFIDTPRVPWWDEIAWMVRRSRRSGVVPSSWLAQSVQFDEPERQRTIDAFLAVYKGLPGNQTTRFMEYLAEATGSGRCDAGLAEGLWMNWDMLREMRRQGMFIGGHTVHHPILARLTRQQQWEEIDGCRRRIQQELGEPMRWFSYPRGKPDSFTQDTRDCLRDAGVELAFSYYGGLRRFDDWDSYDVRRTAVELDVDQHRFEATMTLPQLFA